MSLNLTSDDPNYLFRQPYIDLKILLDEYNYSKFDPGYIYSEKD